MTDNIFDSSGVYTEDELVDIISHPYRMVEELVALEQQISAFMTWQYVIDNDIYHVVSDAQLLRLIDTMYSVEDNNNSTVTTVRWIKNIKDKLLHKVNVVSFIDSIDKIIDKTSNSIKGNNNASKSKQLSEEYMTNKINSIKKLKTKIEASGKFVVKYITLDKQLDRFSGLSAMCKRITDMAEANEVEEFASDKAWDSLASMSNNVAKADEPKQGSSFRRFKWMTPFVKELDLKQSDWTDESKLDELLKQSLTVKKEINVDLIAAATHIKKLCGRMQSEVQHIRNDNLEEVSTQYARAFLVSKLIVSIQAISLKEMNYFYTTGVNTICRTNDKKSIMPFGVTKNKETKEEVDVTDK